MGMVLKRNYRLRGRQEVSLQIKTTTQKVRILQMMKEALSHHRYSPGYFACTFFSNCLYSNILDGVSVMAAAYENGTMIAWVVKFRYDHWRFTATKYRHQGIYHRLYTRCRIRKMSKGR
jgi:hypothetical protein